MFKNYLTIAWRNIRKHKLYSAINIVGLAIGMAACIVIMLFVYYERSFDNQQTKNIFRLNEVQKFPGMVASQKVALSMFPMGPTLKQDFPEVKNFTRIRWNTDFQMTYGDKRVYLPQTFFVDTTFLAMFDYPLLKGNRETALQKPNSIVITESTAHKLFGNNDPVGKLISHYGDDTLNFTVTGIIQDVPMNSQLQFDALLSFNTIYKPDWMNGWGGNWLNTYLELKPNTNVAAMEKRFPAYLKKHMTGDGEGWKFYELFLLPFREVHANAADIGLDYINFQKFDKNYTNIFMIIALIVLAIACINFMNLSTARSAERAKEVGIRKSVGAQRLQLGFQFLGETIVLALFALLLAMVLVILILPYIANLSQRHLGPLFTQHPALIFSVVIGTIGVGIISGIYPAFYLSSFQPSKVLKGAALGNKKSGFRNILVVGQFVSAIFLIIATIFVFRQFNYMQNQDPGFVREQIVNIPLDGVTSRKFDLLKTQLSANSLVAGVTAAQDNLGSHLDQSGIEFHGDGPVRQLTSTRLIVDPDYLSLYKIKLAYGRNFSHEKQANGKEYIINEALGKELLKDNSKAPITSLIGKNFGFDSAGYIVGIAKDFNFNSLHYKIETMFMFNQKDWGFSTVSVKINGARAPESIAFIQQTWKSIFPDHPFSYQFLDDHFKEVYQTDAQITQMVGILAFLAILISCLGLFGLASYSAERRIKEIGVRKVLGASMGSIISLLSRHFIKLVLIANAIAWPLAWYAVNHWMQDYAYRLPMSWWVFILAGLVALAIAVVTVSLLGMKAAKANPVNSLRSE